MKTDQESRSVPEPHEFARRFDGKKQLDLPPVPEKDDLNAMVIVRRKRVKVSERKMTESDRSLAWKSSGKAKARLCVLGFQDPDLTKLPRDSPTLPTASEALIMQWVASHTCRLISSNIKTAFLSGDEDVRKIIIAPPDDVRQMLNLDHDTVLKFEESGVWTTKCTKEMVGTRSENRSSNMVSRVVLSTHVCSS